MSQLENKSFLETLEEFSKYYAEVIGVAADDLCKSINDYFTATSTGDTTEKPKEKSSGCFLEQKHPATKTLHATICMKYDDDSTFCQSTDIPRKGEIIFGEKLDGIVMKVGDGIHTYADLPYVDFKYPERGHRKDVSVFDDYAGDETHKWLENYYKENHIL